MASNGCGLFGGVSLVWRVLARGAPPFEHCCHEHDLAYEQCECEADRKEADQCFRQCMAANGHPRLARVFYYAIRLGGWVTWINPWSGRK